jgi:hypothetical protein
MMSQPTHYNSADRYQTYEQRLDRARESLVGCVILVREDQEDREGTEALIIEYVPEGSSTWNVFQVAHYRCVDPDVPVDQRPYYSYPVSTDWFLLTDQD